MSQNEPNRSSVPDSQLDLLVDGELGESPRRELLAALETEPNGWRRCALAFLEAQSWRQALGSMPATVAEPAAQRARRRSSWTRFGTPLVMAASFLAALLVGFLARPWLFPAAGPAGPVTRLVQEVVRPVAPAGPSSPWQMVTLSVPDGPHGAREPIQLPAIDQDRSDDAWLGNLPQAVPPEMLRALQRSGHRVEQSRQLYPVPLEDGRRLVVPVDQVEIHNVGAEGYQ
jgi:hypothetical protein